MTEVIVTKTQHASITDPNIHNPKGFASASNQTTLIKNINGVLQWVSGYNYLSSIHTHSTSPYGYNFISDSGRYVLVDRSEYPGIQDNIISSIIGFKPAVNNQIISYNSSHIISLEADDGQLSVVCRWIVTNLLSYHDSAWYSIDQYNVEYYGNTINFTQNINNVHFTKYSGSGTINGNYAPTFGISLPDDYGISFFNWRYTRKLYFQYI